MTAISKLWKGSSRTIWSSEWSELDGLLHFQGKIHIPKDPDLWRCIMLQHHDTWISRHAGRLKMLEIVGRHYWWLQMSRYVGQYAKICNLCLWTKAQRQPLIGELDLLSILEHRWDNISVDFIMELLESSRYHVIMNVVDSVSKRAHFISTNTIITALRAAQLYLQHI